MITTWIAGVLLVHYGAMSLIWYAVILAVPENISYLKHTLRPMG